MQKNAHPVSNFQIVNYDFQTKVKNYVTNGKEGEAVSSPPKAYAYGWGIHGIEMTMHNERGTLLKLQATASKLISVCTAAYNGNDDRISEIPGIIARLNDLYSEGFMTEADSHITVQDAPIACDKPDVPGKEGTADAVKPRSEPITMPDAEQGKEPSKPILAHNNKKKRLKPGVKAVLVTLFLTALLGISRLANRNMISAESTPEPTPPVAETTPEPAEAPGATATPKPTPSATSVASAEPEPEETAEPEPSETPDAEKEGDEKTVVRKEPLGTAGRLYFDEGWSVALNYADSNDTESAQTLADAWDSACYMEASGKTMIADHATQGFDIILNYKEGTRATLVDADGNETRIICKSVYKDAYWEDGFTHLPDGRGIWGASDGSIGMQTSTNSDGTEVFISYWDPVEE